MVTLAGPNTLTGDNTFAGSTCETRFRCASNVICANQCPDGVQSTAGHYVVVDNNNLVTRSAVASFYSTSDGGGNAYVGYSYGGINSWFHVASFHNKYLNGQSGETYFVNNGVTKTWTSMSSDSRIKLNQVAFPPQSSLDIVKSVKVKSYYHTGLKRRVKGMIAQEVEAVLPEAVTVTNMSQVDGYEDMRVLSYDRLFVHSFGALQKLKQRATALRALVEQLESEHASRRK